VLAYLQNLNLPEGRRNGMRGLPRTEGAVCHGPSPRRERTDLECHVKNGYECVVVGGGSAGCVVAARPSEDPAVRVALIEAGTTDDAPAVHTRIAFPHLFKSEHDWDYSSEPEAGTLWPTCLPAARQTSWRLFVHERKDLYPSSCGAGTTGAVGPSHPDAAISHDHLQRTKGTRVAGLRRSLGTIGAFGFSLSTLAPTLAMAFTTSLTAKSAGRAAPLTYLVAGAIIAVVGRSFVAFGRRTAHAGSVYAYVGSIFGARSGLVAGWALLLMYLTLLAGATALVGNFAATGLGRTGIEGSNLWLIIAVLAALVAIWLTWRDVRLSGRLTLVLEGTSVLAILLLAMIVLMRVPLSLLPVSARPGPWLDRDRLRDRVRCAVLRWVRERRDIGRGDPKPRAIDSNGGHGTVIAAVLFYVLVSYAQVVGYGLGQVQVLGRAAAPLDDLSTRIISGTFAGLMDFAAAISAFACVVRSLSAASRILYALGRSGLAPSLVEVDAKHGTPVRSIMVVGIVNLLCLLLWGARSDAIGYSGNIVTVGTLSLILVYVSATAAQAVHAFRCRRLVWITCSLGAVLLLWPL
jgi:amino acid transporter